ncbi:MAG TPA: TolC family protein [Vicinamibacterales bacterium]|nr:TolC family protein [Vicinamibacterales bacterium]
MRRLVMLAIGACLLASPASAQTPVAVTFDEAVARAIERHPTVARAAKAILQAEAVIDQARALTRPSIDATFVNATINERVAFDDATIAPRNQSTFSARASLPVLAPARWARVAQARDQVAIASASTAEVRQQIARAAAEAFLGVVAARRQVEVDERALETGSAHLDYARRRLEGGVGSRLNMLRAAQEVSAAEARAESARLALRQAQEALGVLLVEDGPVDAAGTAALDVPGVVDESAWMAARPDLVTQGAIIRAAERVVRDSWKDVAPEGTLAFDPQYLTPAGLFQPSGTWRLSITVTQPIFQGGLQRAVARGRQLTLDTQRIALTELENQARADIRIAQAAVASFERTLEHSRQSAREAEEVLTITTTVFEVGATTNIELIDAQRSARDRETVVTITENALQRARLQLLVALGRFPR